MPPLNNPAKVPAKSSQWPVYTSIFGLVAVAGWLVNTVLFAAV